MTKDAFEQRSGPTSRRYIGRISVDPLDQGYSALFLLHEGGWAILEVRCNGKEVRECVTADPIQGIAIQEFVPKNFGSGGMKTRKIVKGEIEIMLQKVSLLVGQIF